MTAAKEVNHLYLKSLELHGFKSFPEKTVLQFDAGATVIVGPNGSGKSNITDAMRWVLGELSSRSIRGSKMEDVIFIGADGRKPMSFAEVSVTFDNTGEQRINSPYDEITVTRRYYRAGESEYLINRKPCRLKDIYELFMNTGIGREGYSIIGQGKIAEIISKKSDDRRGIFEESAGISKYRYKKKESEKKLAETEANMERVGDIERELEARIGPLERDSAKARQYLELYNEKKKTDISLWLYDSVRLKAAIEKTENDTKISAHELEMAQDSLEQTSAKIERMYEQSHDNKEAARRNYEETSAMTKKMTDAESESRMLTKERIHTESLLASESSMLENAKRTVEIEAERRDATVEKLSEIGEKCMTAQAECDAKAEAIAKLKAEIEEYTAELDSRFADQKAAEHTLTDLRVRLNVLENSISSQKERTESINSDVMKYEAEIASLEREVEAADEQIAAYSALTAEMDEKVAACEKEAEGLSKEFSVIDAELRRAQAEIDSLDSRISAITRMQEHFDGYNNSIKHIMRESAEGRLRGIRGPLSYLIKVERDYIVAIETSLGGALQNIVCDDENAAKASIESLKRNNAGRATFYPITTVRAQERGRDYDGLESFSGFVGWADHLVSCDDEYRNIVKSLLARVVVFDNIDNASSAAKAKGWKIRAVTLDGQQINSGGSFTGGQTKRDSGMLSRSAQIESLKAEREKALLSLTEVDSKAKAIREKIASATSEAKREADRRGLIEAMINTEEKSKSDATGRITALTNLVVNMKKDSETLAESNSRIEEDLARLRESIAAQAHRIAEISASRDDVASKRGACELSLAELEEAQAELRIHLAEFLRDREAAEISLRETIERLTLADGDTTARGDSIKALSDKITELEKTAEAKLAEAEEYRSSIDRLRDRQKSLENIGDDIESGITELRKLEKEQTSTKELSFLAHSKNETKLASLKEEDVKLTSRLWDDYEFTYATAQAFAEENDCHVITDGERNRFQNEQNELRRKIKALGHVNVDAIEEYTEVKARYEHIKTQLDDLRASHKDLTKILSEIEEDMKRIFLEAFAKINTYFGEVFRELFGGGHAEVVLTDPENALESGIEINAAPPGKTIKNLNLLSGGEQAFIAIALLFALIKVNPSPFCIIDEIEAALDEVNVTRVGNYVKKYSREMQIIMISHRRGTMDIADTLYGVTMQQSGVSKVFTLESSDDRELLLK
ncbi:MAG: chromosome segregation protein SMC [Clostridia bacterium]|nr:chromosome segregation protein SMC [Clostridia bacterium]